MASSLQRLPKNEGSPPASPLPLVDSIISDDQRENDLFNLIDQLIHQYMTEPNRRHPYWTRLRWFFDDGTNLAYHVSLSINEDTPSP